MAVKKAGESKVKQVVGGIAVALALILAGGVCGGLLQHHYNWGAEKPPVEDSTGGEEKPEDSGGGEVSTEAGVSHGIKLAAVKLASSEYDEYGVSPLAETAYTLTATITPADAANKAVDWTIAFKNASSTWATGKTVTEYATVTPSADGALTAVVENVAAFGEQIVVKATSRDNADAYATCTVEYLQRTTGYSFTMRGTDISVDYATTGTTKNNVRPTFATTRSASAWITVNKSTVYTRANTDKAEYFTIKPTADFKNWITEMELDASKLKEYTGTGSATVTLENYFDSVCGSALYSTNEEKNKLITALSMYSSNAYEIKIYTENGGAELAAFGIMMDPTVIIDQKGVESIEIDETEIVF